LAFSTQLQGITDCNGRFYGSDHQARIDVGKIEIVMIRLTGTGYGL